MSRLGALALVALLMGSSAAAADPVHVVQPGETLWQIAAVLSGDPHRWPEIYRANRDQIKDPSRLYPGQELSIPDFGDAARRPVAAPGTASAPDERS